MTSYKRDLRSQIEVDGNLVSRRSKDELYIYMIRLKSVYESVESNSSEDVKKNEYIIFHTLLFDKKQKKFNSL